MELDKARQLLNDPRLLEEHARRPQRLAIRVFRPASLGATPQVAIQSITAGFDWDQGVLLVNPDQELTVLSPQDVADIRKSVAAGQSWHAYQAHKAQQEIIQKLRDFANRMVDIAFQGGNADGATIQEAATELGLLEPVQADEACGDHCNCLEYGFPTTCYRRTKALRR